MNDWSRAVFARAMIADYGVTKNPAILESLSRNYLTTPRLYGGTLACTNIEVLCWLYAQTGNQALLEMAEESYRKGNQQQQILNPSGHAVCYCEKPMLPAILYNHTGKQEYLDTVVNGLEALEEEHVLVDGVPSGVEDLYGKEPDCAHEMCNVMALSWSYGYVLMATKDPVWADKIERIVFNAGLGGITKDFRAHQYYSAPNQAIAAEHNSRYNDGSFWGACARARLAYRTGHDTECCTGNIHRMLPNYVKRMWMVDRQSNGIAATLYGPGSVTAQVGEETAGRPDHRDDQLSVLREHRIHGVYRETGRIHTFASHSRVVRRSDHRHQRPQAGSSPQGRHVCRARSHVPKR